MNNGAFGENFPYSNFHDLNMDWIIKIAKDFLDQYTNLQQMISDGETSLTNLTNSGLEQLQDKADNLEELLQDWYDTHSEDIADQLASALQDITNQLASAISSFNSSANTKSQELLNSWHSDYSQLVTWVNELLREYELLLETSFNGIKENYFENGQYQVNDTIANHTASTNTGIYKEIFPLESDIEGIQVESGYKIAIAGFNASGVCIEAPSQWLTPTTTPITRNDIIHALYSTQNTHFSFQIRLTDNSNYDFSTLDSKSVVKLIRPIKIKHNNYQNNSIDYSKLDEDVISGLIKYNAVTMDQMHNGQIQVGQTLTNFLASANTGFYPALLPLDETLLDVELLDPTYKIAFDGFNEQGECIATSFSWATDTHYTREQILSNLSAQGATLFTFQIRPVNSAMTAFLAVDPKTVVKCIYSNTDDIEYDLIMFAGQSNMAGRGSVADAPTLIPGAGYEYRPISDPTKLYPITEPFGVNENNPTGINDENRKTGSLVTAFVNSYYKITKTPIIAVSASEGGSNIGQWTPGATNSRIVDALQRFANAQTFLANNGYRVRHKYFIWCQGETDADISTSKTNYINAFKAMLYSIITAGFEKLFMIRIGEYNSETTPNPYAQMISWQTEIAQTEPKVVMVSTDFAGMRERELMKDTFHYYQEGYNEVGTYAGVNTAFYEGTNKEPTMYDPEYNNLYYGHKN